jgi:hypothetical protein
MTDGRAATRCDAVQMLFAAIAALATTFPVYTIESAPEPSKPALQQLQSAFARISAPVARWNCFAAACTVASATTTDNEGVTTSHQPRG